MKLFSLVPRNLRYYWRTDLAVLLGVVSATAVVSGALLVGDSVRGSLRAMSLARLGGIDHALVSQRFFREDLARELHERPGFSGRFGTAAPALVFLASLESSREGAVHRVGRVQIYGVDERMWQLTEHGELPPPAGREILVNRRVADQLALSGAPAGEEARVTLSIELPADIPRDALLGERDNASRQIEFTVRDVIDERLGVGRFDVNPSQQLPLAAFVPLGTLQESLDLAQAPPSRRNPQGLPARVNALFVHALAAADAEGASADDAARALTAEVAQCLTLDDIDLRITRHAERGYFSLESNRQILEDALAQTADRVADGLGLAKSPVLVYLANELINAKDPSRFSMYSVIAGVDFRHLHEAPFGPFATQSAKGQTAPAAGEILINDWLAQDLGVQAGESIRVRYHVVGSHGELPEREAEFTVAGVVEMSDPAVADAGIVPEVKGITDAKSFRDWDQPFPMQLDRITERDEEYWDRYRTAPKGFVPLAAAQDLWGSRYGRLTSLRVAAKVDRSLDETADLFAAQLLKSLTPEQTGLALRPVKLEGVRAAAGSNDFSQLFLGFSFFLILSAAILIGLMFRLGIERRGTGVGLLEAVGFPPRLVGRLLFSEGLVLVLCGGLIGSAAAVGYARLMVLGLKTWWNRAIGTQSLDVYVSPSSLGTGFAASVGVAVVAVWWGLRQLKSLEAREMLAGMTQPARGDDDVRRRGRASRWFVRGALLVCVLLLGGAITGLIPSGEALGGLSWRVVSFFIVGLLLLGTSWTSLGLWLDSSRAPAVRGRGLRAIGRLGVKNAARHRLRSVMTAGLISSAAFVIVAIAAGHRNPAAERPDRNSGNGGFLLVAQSSRPILYDLNSAEGRERLELPPLSAAGGDKPPSVGVTSFRVQPGEDASCLNAYQTRTPTILGVPRAMIERGGFKFVGAGVENPWTLLDAPQPDGAIPVLGDMNTLQFSLHKGPGDVIAVPDGRQRPHVLRIAGMFDGSVFQGVLLMSEENFLKLYPDRAGYEYFLIERPLAGEDDPRQAAQQLSDWLETGLRDYGLDAEPVSERLADFLAVQNTYLSTFQTLGGLGLLLGTFGLATVMLRNVLERRGELALLRAIGYRSGHLACLVLAENAFLLAWGLLTGTGAALLAMTPHLLSIGADVPWTSVALILGSVFVAGTAAALLAVSQAVRTPVLATLRAE